MSKKNRNREEVVNIDENMVNMLNEVVVEDTVTEDEAVEVPAVEEVITEEEVVIEEVVEETPAVAPVEEVKEEVAPVVEEVIEEIKEEVNEEVKLVEDVVVKDGDCVIEISVLDERKGKIVRDRIRDIAKDVRVCGKKVVVGPFIDGEAALMVKKLLIRKGLRGTIVKK